MNKFKYMTKQEIGQYVTELETELRTCNFERMKEIEAEIRSANEALTKGEYRKTEDNEEEFRSEKLNGPHGGINQRSGFNPIATFYMASHQTPSGNNPAEIRQKYESRGADLKDKKSVTFDLAEVPEFRAVTIGGGSLVVPQQSSSTLNTTFNEVSKVVDLVNAVPLMGGESYKKGFEVSYGEGDYTTETGEYKEDDPVTDYVTIGKAKITAYTEMSDEAMKLPNVDYQAMVAKNIGIALRKKASKQILVGPGGANELTGIFHAPENVIPAASDIEITGIDEETLDKIVFAYGGAEDVEGGCTLILNKDDLATFNSIRASDGKKLYEIEFDGNVGTISSGKSFKVNFIINSVCPALSVVATQTGTYCMAYGKLQAYEMPIFSPITVEESRDFKFKTGQICYRGSVWAGGNVAAYKGFLRIKKK